MSIGRKLTSGLLMAGAALAGSYVGEGLRGAADHAATGGSAATMQEFDVQKLAAAAVPGFILAMLAGWPRTLYAFLGALCAATWLGGGRSGIGQLMERAIGRPGGRS